MSECKPLIMGSDGLWDNVPAQEIAAVYAAQRAAGKDAQEVAEAIATCAFEHSAGAYTPPLVSST